MYACALGTSSTIVALFIAVLTACPIARRISPIIPDTRTYPGRVVSSIAAKVALVTGINTCLPAKSSATTFVFGVARVSTNSLTMCEDQTEVSTLTSPSSNIYSATVLIS